MGYWEHLAHLAGTCALVWICLHLMQRVQRLERRSHKDCKIHEDVFELQCQTAVLESRHQALDKRVADVQGKVASLPWQGPYR